MRKFNIFLMLGAAIIAFLAIFPPLVKTRNMAYLAKITSSLLAIIVIPLGCAVRLINSNVKSAKAQTEISISYIATLIATTIISSSVGSTPYAMRSMNIGFINSLKHIAPLLLLGGAIATISHVLAHVLINRKNIHQLQVKRTAHNNRFKSFASLSGTAYRGPLT